MALTRSALLGAAGCLLALMASRVFDDRAIEILIVPVVVTFSAVAASRFGIGIQIAAVTSAVALSTALVVLIDGGTFGDAVPGVVDGPRRLLSTEWPSPLDPSIVATLALFVGACTAIALVLGLRERWRLLPLLPILVGATALMGLSAVSPPSRWLFVALGAIAVAFALANPSRLASRTPKAFTADGTVVATVGVVALATVMTASAVAWADRADPRSTDEPEASETLLDPIEATVAMRRANPVVDLMTISDRSPLARPAMPPQWRLAAFDVYDGQRWVPSIDLRPIGGVLAAVPADDSSVIVYAVTYHGQRIDLVPFPGRPVSVDRDVMTDFDRVAVRLTDPPDASTIVEAEAIPAPSTADADVIGTASRQVDEIAATFTDQARRLAGEGTGAEQLGRLAQTMRSEWDLDPGAPGAGLQQALIGRFITETQRGSREQFVTAYALLARAIGFDTRIAAGFIVPPEELGSTFSLRTDHSAIWPEVRLEDGSWLAFDPVPEDEAADDELPPPQRPAQTPAAAQPPIAPPAEDEPPDEEVVIDEEEASDGWSTAAVWAARVGVVTGIVLAPFLIAIGLVLWLKWRRRRARLTAPEPGARVRGAWANATDSFVDAGLAISPAWTDDHIAASAATMVSGVPHETRRLAAMSSAVTFGTRSRDESSRLALDAAATATSIDDAIRTSRTRWERVKWRLSLRSLRGSTRSPVIP